MHVRAETWSGLHPVNEDRHLCDEVAGLFAVLDGEFNGGHAADIALSSLRDCCGKLVTLGKDDAIQRTQDILQGAMREAAQQTYQAASSPECRGEGTSLTCIVLVGGMLFTAHVGDSRLYRFRSGAWGLMTRDDSLVQDVRESGDAETLAAAREMHSTVITKALGFSDETEVRIEESPLKAGDLFLLLTDGAWRPFDQDLDGSEPPALVGEALIAWLRAKYKEDGEADNATVVLIEPD